MLVDRQVLKRIVDFARIGKAETVIEAGTGLGILTAELCKTAKSVVSYEVDKKLYLQAKLHLPFLNLKLVNDDLFETTYLNFDVFVSNLPYSRSRDAFEWLATQKFDRAVIMVQQEFADKLTARPGDKGYRAISALSAYCFATEKLFRVEPQSFKPQPKVKSAVLGIVPVNMVSKEVINALNLLFSKRNRRASTVASMVGAETRSHFDTKRIDELEPGDLMSIAEAMSNVRSI